MVQATPEFNLVVVPLLGETEDHGMSRMLTMCWIIAQGPTESTVRVSSHPTPVLIK